VPKWRKRSCSPFGQDRYLVPDVEASAVQLPEQRPIAAAIRHVGIHLGYDLFDGGAAAVKRNMKRNWLKLRRIGELTTRSSLLSTLPYNKLERNTDLKVSEELWLRSESNRVLQQELLQGPR